MATVNKNLSDYTGNNIIDITSKKFVVIVSEWNEEVTDALYSGAVTTLLKHGAKKENIVKKMVPGSFELSLGAQWAAEDKTVDAVICIGCVVQGETKHPANDEKRKGNKRISERKEIHESRAKTKN